MVAHVVRQHDNASHWRNHITMQRFAVNLSDCFEVAGQLSRLTLVKRFMGVHDLNFSSNICGASWFDQLRVQQECWQDTVCVNHGVSALKELWPLTKHHKWSFWTICAARLLH